MKDINLIRIFYMVCQSVLMYYLCVHFHVYYCTSNSSILTHIFIYFFKFSENVTLASLSVTQRLLALHLTSWQPRPSPIYLSPGREPCWSSSLSPGNHCTWPAMSHKPWPLPTSISHSTRWTPGGITVCHPVTAVPLPEVTLIPGPATRPSFSAQLRCHIGVPVHQNATSGPSPDVTKPCPMSSLRNDVISCLLF